MVIYAVGSFGFIKNLVEKIRKQNFGGKMLRKLKYALPIALATSLATGSLQANTLAKHYKGKTVSIIIPYGPGGTYDKYGSTFARHIGRHIPGDPTVIVQYMPGAGGSKAMNYMYNAAPKYGYVTTVPLDNIVVNQVLRPKKMRYKANKFTWLGSSNQTNSVMVVASRTGVHKIMDAKTKPIIGSTAGYSSSTFLFCRLAAGLLGLKIKMIAGYKGSSRSMFAIETGEADMTAPNWLAWDSKVPHWFGGKKPFAKAVLQNGVFVDPDLPNVPMLSDLVKPKDKPLVMFLASAGPLGRGLTMPPGVPKNLIPGLRSAYKKMNADPRFRAELKKRRLRLISSTGEQIQKVVEDALKATSPAVVKRVRKIVYGK